MMITLIKELLKMETLDHLNLFKDPDILKMIGDETLIFTGKITKENRFWTKQERNILVTNIAIYNMKKKEVKRRIDISKIRGLTVSKQSDEFVIHGNNDEYDYLLISHNKGQLVKVIDNAYYTLTDQHLLFSQLNTKNLSSVVTTKKEKKKDPDVSKMNVDELSDITQYTSTIVICEQLQGTANFKPICKYREASFNDFDIISVIGKGKGSTIYMGVFKEDNNPYAIKSIRKEYIIDHDLIDQVLLEKHIMTSFENFHFIPRLNFIFETETTVDLVMPYMKKGDLFTYLKDNKNLDENTVIQIAAQLAVIIDFFHSKSIILRDIKPENLLIQDDGYLQLCDYGSAKVLNNVNEFRASLVGTPEYLSPEVVNGDGHTKITDWWNVGILIYELLYGFPPFYDENIERVFDLITLSEIKFPSEMNISYNAKDIIQKVRYMIYIMLIIKHSCWKRITKED